MPTKRKNTRKKASPGLPKAFGRAGSKKQAEPSLKLVLKRLDTFDQRFDALDQKIGAVDQKVEVVRQETAAEFKAVRDEMTQGLAAVRGEMTLGLAAVRGEMTQGLAAVRGEMTLGLAAVRGEMAQGLAAVRGEMAQGFANMGKTITAEIQSVRNDVVKYYSQRDRKIDENDERYQQRHNQLLTGMDVMAKNYEQFGHNSAIIDAEHRDLKKDVETLKKRDMEKTAAIDKIEKEIDKLKAA
jgi:hypothetical protein